MKEPVRVAIVDDHSLFLTGVERCLRMHSEFQVIATGKSAEEALEIAINLRPDLLLLDIKIPGDGLCALKAIKREVPSIRIAMLTGSDSKEHIQEAMRSGAQEYILKGVDNEQLIEALTSIAGGEKWVCEDEAACADAHLDPNAPPTGTETDSSLSRRECQILELLGKGLTNQEICLKTRMPMRAVKYTISSIFDKIRVRNRSEAALYFMRRH